MNTFFSIHTHSRYSIKDALPSVPEVIAKAVELGYPALGLTDHGTMAGAAQLYTGCRKAGIEPLPGIEAYLAFDRLGPGRPKTVHLGLLATTGAGYTNLVHLTTAMATNFRYVPVVDLGDLAKAASLGLLDGIIALTGCWFGLLPTLLRTEEPELGTRVQNVLGALASWFSGRLYVELQHHGMADDEHDDDLHTHLLYGLANKLGLPMVLTQDSHYCELGDRSLHEVMKRLGSWSDSPDDAVFPGDGYHMVDGLWMRAHHEPAHYAAGIAGLSEIYEGAKVVIPTLDTYRLSVPDLSVLDTPDAELRKAVEAALQARYKAGEIKHAALPLYTERLAEELAVVVDTGFAGYLLFVAWVCKWMSEHSIYFNTRGSASGSLLCWLLGITSFDVITWKLGFDRFLSRDKKHPPDVDLDVEHTRRQEVVDMLSHQFHVVHISTWMKLGLDEEADSDGEQKGSLLVQWKQHARKTGADPFAPVPPEQWAVMRSLAAMKPYAGYGVHPAGLIVTTDESAVDGVVPLQWVASSKTLVTAFDMFDIEKFGLLKLDVLGLKTLSALKTTITLSGVDPDSVPLNDPATYAAMSAGRTTGCFQLDGYTAMKGICRLKPTRITDVIAAMALFRPATMASGATDAYIARRHKHATIPVMHPIITAATAATYGVLVYQEQAITLLKGIGLGIEDIEAARAAVKASTVSQVAAARLVMADILAKVNELGAAKGMDANDLAWVEQGIAAYAGYGFNLAHATSYGVLAYITTWYSVHHPIPFWTGLLVAYTGDKLKEPRYLRECKARGVTIRGPHVNASGIDYTADLEHSSIRRGLASIGGVGPKASAELVAKAPFADLADLAARVVPRAVTGTKALGAGGHTPAACGGVIAKLEAAGALAGLDVPAGAR